MWLIIWCTCAANFSIIVFFSFFCRFSLPSNWYANTSEGVAKEGREPSQIFQVEALGALSKHLGVVQQWSSHHHQKVACQDYVAQAICAVVVVSFDCIRPIVVFHVPVVLHVWIGITQYCLYGGVCFVFGLKSKSSPNQQWHCSVLSDSTWQFP